MRTILAASILGGFLLTGCGPTPSHAEAEQNPATVSQAVSSDGSAVPAREDGTVTRRVWSGPGVDYLGAPSPDGRYLSFVDWTTGDQAIRDLRTGENRRLTDKGSWWESTEFALFSTFAPDGERLAVGWFNDDFLYDLRILALDGSDPEILYRNESVLYIQPVDWSRDGEWILALFSREDQTNQIVLVSTADGSVRVLKTLDWRYPFKMTLSPDGRHVVYDFPPEEPSRERDIYVLAVDGSRETKLVEGPSNDLVMGWAPDGRHILFASDRGGTLGAWVVPVNERGEAEGRPVLAKPDLWRAFPIGFTRSGAYFYGVNTAIRDIQTAAIDLDAGGLTSAPAPVAPRLFGPKRRPQWSPDGRLLVYQFNRTPIPGNLGPRYLAIRSIETGETRELAVTDLNYFGTARWSPDGRTFVTTGTDRKGRSGVFAIDAQTGRVETLVRMGPRDYTQWADWLSDGESILYKVNVNDGSSTRVVHRDLATGEERVLYELERPSMITFHLALSPDRRTLAFKVFREDEWDEIRMMPVVGGEPSVLLRIDKGERGIGSFAWSADGRHLIYMDQSENLEDQTPEVFRIPVAGGEPVRLDIEIEGFRRFHFHPDGGRIAFQSGRVEGEIWVMEDFLPSTDREPVSSRP